MSQTRYPCIRCDHCVPVCPEALQPQQLFFFSRNGQLEEAKDRRLFDCTECGACEAVCPSLLPLVETFQHSKAAIMAQQAADRQAEAWRQRFERHQARREWDRVRQNERKLEKLQNKLENLAAGQTISRNQESIVPSSGAPTPATSQAVAVKTQAQIKADIDAAVARARARKAALQDKTGSGDPQS